MSLTAVWDLVRLTAASDRPRIDKQQVIVMQQTAQVPLKEQAVLTTSEVVRLEIASFSLKTGTTFMASRSSVVADRFFRKSASAKSLLVTRT